MVICSTVTIVVSIYTFRVARRLANTVTPLVNLPVIPTISHDIKRTSNDPHSFQRIKLTPKAVPTCHIISNGWTSELLQTAKNAVKFNVISLFTLVVLLPENIFNTWVFFSGSNCTNDPDFPSRAKWVLMFEFACLIVYPYLIKRKLENLS